MCRHISIIGSLIVICFLAACTSGNRKEAFSQFVHLPHHQWQRTVPCYFKPTVESDDCEITVALRHESEYLHDKVALTIDIINADTLTLRKSTMITLVDDIGNWTSSGFGSLYQCNIPVASGVKLDSTSVILVWQSMDCDTLRHITDVGIDIKTTEQQK